MYGLGAGYTFREHFQVRIDWIAVPNVGDESETGEGNVQLFTAGFRYRF
jgi:long-subunit fatty acid transport protein